MKVNWVEVVLEKRLSDGNYGHEMASVRLNAEVDSGDLPDQVLESLRSMARAHLLAELSTSTSPAIRGALLDPMGPKPMRAGLGPQSSAAATAEALGFRN